MRPMYVTNMLAYKLTSDSHSNFTIMILDRLHLLILPSLLEWTHYSESEICAKIIFDKTAGAPKCCWPLCIAVCTIHCYATAICLLFCHM